MAFDYDVGDEVQNEDGATLRVEGDKVTIVMSNEGGGYNSTTCDVRELLAAIRKRRMVAVLLGLDVDEESAAVVMRKNDWVWVGAYLDNPEHTTKISALMAVREEIRKAVGK